MSRTKNITVTVPEEIYRAARVHAAEGGSSVSALVADYLRSLGEHASEFSRLKGLQGQVFDEIDRFRGADRLDRDELHRRAVR